MNLNLNHVASLIRNIAANEILPRFKKLQTTEKWEKRPGSIVTSADVAAENELARELPLLLPGSNVVGEEMIEETPSAIHLLDEAAPVWVLDAVDGTANFAKGSSDFGVMVALVKKRRTIAGWVFRPIQDEMYIAESGAGAFLNEKRLEIKASPRRLREMTGSLGGFLRNKTNVSSYFAGVTATRCIAVDYCALLKSNIHFAHYRGVRVWDHAAGYLLHVEAGGYCRCLDDTEYFAGKPGKGGILLASDREAWEIISEPVYDAVSKVI